MGHLHRRKRALGGYASGTFSRYVLDVLECRWLLTTVTLDAGTTYQTIQGWGTAPIYPTDKVTIAQAGAIMRDAGMNTVRITAGPGEFTYTTGGNLTTPVPISANLADNVAKFGTTGENTEADLVKWLETNGLQPDRTKMIGSLWSPPQWMKVSTGTYYSGNGTASGYDPVLPYGANGGNTAGGTVNPSMWTDWARYVLSDVEWWEQQTGLPMYAFSFQNEPDVQVNYSSMFLNRTAVDPNDPTKGTNTGQWQLYGDALQALSTELAAHPEITTKFFGPELEELGPAVSNPWFLSEYYQIRQNLIDRGLLGDLGGYAWHQYQEPKDGDAATWDAFYNGSAHAAQILSNGTSSVLGWLWPSSSTVGAAADNKEIWQTETDGENQTWTKDGAMSYGLKIFDALVYGHVSGYAAWTLVSYNPGDAAGMVDLANVNNPMSSYKYDAFKQFSRWINPGAQMIKATFDNGQASVGGANSLDTYNGLNVASFNQAQDKRRTTVFVNMQTTDQTVTVNLPAGMNIGSLQVYETSGTEKYAQLADLIPVNGKVTLTIPASSFVTITGSYAATTLPAPWVSSDIGAPSPAGAAAFNSSTNTFTVSGAGSDIWNNSDQFQFASRTLTGDGAVIARVTGIQNTDPWAKAGVMVRDSADPDTMFADVVVSASSGISFQWRNSTGGYAGATTVGSQLAPAWVKLVRTGNTFSAFYATTSGTPSAADWVPIGTAQTIAMGSHTEAGLAVTSHDSGVLTTATFTGVQVDESPTVATAAAATPGTVTGTSTSLSVLGADADGGGESNLSYTWSATGPGAVTFSGNGTNAAKNTTATFSKAGSYTLQVAITDSAQQAVISSTTVSVVQTLTSIALSPALAALVAFQTQQFTAVALDQFGNALAAQPTITWSVDAGSVGSIDQTGLYAPPGIGAPKLGGSASVRASAGGVSAAVPVTINVLMGDANGDGVVNGDDLQIVMAHFGQMTSAWTDGNFVGDPRVDLSDISVVQNNLGTSLPPQAGGSGGLTGVAVPTGPDPAPTGGDSAPTGTGAVDPTPAPSGPVTAGGTPAPVPPVATGTAQAPTWTTVDPSPVSAPAESGSTDPTIGAPSGGDPSDPISPPMNTAPSPVAESAPRVPIVILDPAMWNPAVFMPLGLLDVTLLLPRPHQRHHKAAVATHAAMTAARHTSRVDSSEAPQSRVRGRGR